MSTSTQNLKRLHDRVQPDLLLNLFPANAAYSTARKLDLNYPGSAIRVRRSSDSAEQDIGFDANGDLDVTALTTFVGANDGFVTILYDQSGNGDDAIQATAGFQPQIVDAGVLNTNVAGRPETRFDGVDDFMETNLSTNITGQDTSMFMVADIPSTTNFQGVVTGIGVGAVNDSDNAASYIYVGREGTTNQVFAFSINLRRSIVAGVIGTGDHQLTSILAANDSRIFRDGVAGSDLADRTGNLDIERILLAARFQGSAVSFFSQMGMSEFILYNTNENSNRLPIETNQKTFYGTP